MPPHEPPKLIERAKRKFCSACYAQINQADGSYYKGFWLHLEEQHTPAPLLNRPEYQAWEKQEGRSLEELAAVVRKVGAKPHPR